MADLADKVHWQCTRSRLLFYLGGVGKDSLGENMYYLIRKKYTETSMHYFHMNTLEDTKKYKNDEVLNLLRNATSVTTDLNTWDGRLMSEQSVLKYVQVTDLVRNW